MHARAAWEAGEMPAFMSRLPLSMRRGGALGGDYSEGFLRDGLLMNRGRKSLGLTYPLVTNVSRLVTRLDSTLRAVWSCAMHSDFAFYICSCFLSRYIGGHVAQRFRLLYMHLFRSDARYIDGHALLHSDFALCIGSI